MTNGRRNGNVRRPAPARTIVQAPSQLRTVRQGLVTEAKNRVRARRI